MYQQQDIFRFASLRFDATRNWHTVRILTPGSRHRYTPTS
jgi:hypothetical protein